MVLMIVGAGAEEDKLVLTLVRQIQSLLTFTVPVDIQSITF